MIRTVRCRLCGQALEAFLEFAPGLPLVVSEQAMQSKLNTAQIRHADRCPARRLLTSPPTNGRSVEQPVRAWSGAFARSMRIAVRRLRRLAL
jgi:hypothetical protein